MAKTTKELQEMLEAVYRMERGEVDKFDDPEDWFGRFCDAMDYLAAHPEELPLESFPILLAAFDDERFANPDQVEVMELMLMAAGVRGEAGFDAFLRAFPSLPDTAGFVGVWAAVTNTTQVPAWLALLETALPRQTAEVKAAIRRKLDTGARYLQDTPEGRDALALWQRLAV